MSSLYRGGIVFWGDLVGAKHVASRLNSLSQSYGNFFKPCAWLQHCAARGLKLSSPVQNGAKARL